MKNFLIFQEVTFQARKNKKDRAPENFLYFRKRKPRKIFLYFLKKKAVLIFRGTETPKKIPYISGNGTFLYFKKVLIFQEITFRARKVKRTLSEKLPTFWEMELSSSNLKKA